MSGHALAIHGGAGYISAPARTEARAREYHDALHSVLAAGHDLLSRGGSAVDAVTLAVQLLEDCPLFNAGRGAVLNADGEHELEASVMDGASGGSGGLIGVRRVRNPVLAARALMERSGPVLLFGTAADRFAAEAGMELVEPAFFTTPERVEQLRWAKAMAAGAMLDHDADALSEISDPDEQTGTVGAVARDRQGNLAAATSTGGLTNKKPGRVGDSAIIGAGCYADNRGAAVSTTGVGECFLRAVAARDVSALIEYAGMTVEDAAEQVIMQRLPRLGGRGGLIAVDGRGHVAMPFNTQAMYRGLVTNRRAAHTYID